MRKKPARGKLFLNQRLTTMKKTLFTLLALGSVSLVATGTTSEDLLTYDEVLTMPGSQNNGGHGSVTNPINTFSSYNMGVYLYNGGGQVNTNTTTGEGIWNNAEGVTSVVLCKRGGAGGSGEAIVLDHTVIGTGMKVSGLSFSVANSSSETLTGTISLTLVLCRNDNGTWDTVASHTETLTLGSGATTAITFNEGNEIVWNDSYKIIGLLDGLNGASDISGSNGQAYTLSGITMKATVPEPATATLSLLALAGLASRRRRK